MAAQASCDPVIPIAADKLFSRRLGKKNARSAPHQGSQGYSEGNNLPGPHRNLEEEDVTVLVQSEVEDVEIEIGSLSSNDLNSYGYSFGPFSSSLAEENATAIVAQAVGYGWMPMRIQIDAPRMSTVKIRDIVSTLSIVLQNREVVRVVELLESTEERLPGEALTYYSAILFYDQAAPFL